jgi:hypothetical protein
MKVEACTGPWFQSPAGGGGRKGGGAERYQSLNSALKQVPGPGIFPEPASEQILNKG